MYVLREGASYRKFFFFVLNDVHDTDDGEGNQCEMNNLKYEPEIPEYP